MLSVHSLSVSLVDCLLKECEDRKNRVVLKSYERGAIGN